MKAKEFKEKYKEELKKVPIDLDNPKHGWAGWWLEEQVEYLMESYAKQYHASQQMPSEEDILKEINCASFDVLIDDEFISVIRYSEMKKILKDEFGINKSLQQESQTEE